MTHIDIFNDPNKVPRPKNEVHIERLEAVPYPDRFRVHVEIEVTAFQERPNLLLVLRAADGSVMNELNIIETMHSEMEFTLHIRNVEDPAGDYSLDCELFYESRNPPQDHKTIQFNIPESDE